MSRFGVKMAAIISQGVFELTPLDADDGFEVLI